MPIRLVWLDGFDMTTGGFKMLQKYPTSLITFLQSGVAAGATAGQSLELINAAFGEMNLTKIIGTSDAIIGHFNFRWQTTGTVLNTPDMEFFNISLAGQKYWALRQRTDGRIDIRTYHSTTPITLGTESTVINLNTWYTLEFRVTFGPSGSWQIRINGSEPLSGGHDSGIDFGFNKPDRCSFHFVGFGNPNLRLDNYALGVTDPDGQIPDDFSDGMLGRLAIQSLYPISDANRNTGTAAWTRNTGTDNYKVILDLPPLMGGLASAAPDGEASFLENNAAGATAYFKMLKPNCLGRVLGVATNVDVKPLTGSPLLNMLVRLVNTHTIPGPPTILSTGTTIEGFDANMIGYAAYQCISAVNPETSSLWTDGDIGEADWGLGADLSSVKVHASQFYLEKAYTLLGKPFECGGLGSYAV